jgi:hypothetical protein
MEVFSNFNILRKYKKLQIAVRSKNTEHCCFSAFDTKAAEIEFGELHAEDSSSCN